MFAVVPGRIDVYAEPSTRKFKASPAWSERNIRSGIDVGLGVIVSR
jgi:hypothetical protein